MNKAICGVPNALACKEQPLRALRANHVFCTDEAAVQKTWLLEVQVQCWGFIQDRRLRADVLFMRAQATIRADGFLSAQKAV